MRKITPLDPRPDDRACRKISVATKTIRPFDGFLDLPKSTRGPAPMAQYDVIVLGGGTMGIACAWDLAKRGKHALVLEQFDFVHDRGAHSGRTRIFRHAYAEGAEYIPLVMRADQLWQDLE